MTLETAPAALVTGAGRGLGRAIADHLAETGMTVHGTARDGATADAIAERYGTAPILLDLRHPESVAEAVDGLQSRGAGITRLVNNAGINVPSAAVDVRAEDWDLVLATNARGPLLLSQALARGWIERGDDGAIVNIASQAGIVAIEERAAYGASKAALIHLTKVLALEWAPHRIRVNAVAPTFVRTELTASTLARPDWAKELLGRIPLGRFGEPEEIVGAVGFLLSPGASLITGQTLAIDGGYTIR